MATNTPQRDDKHTRARKHHYLLVGTTWGTALTAILGYFGIWHYLNQSQVVPGAQTASGSASTIVQYGQPQGTGYGGDDGDGGYGYGDDGQGGYGGGSSGYSSGYGGGGFGGSSGFGSSSQFGSGVSQSQAPDFSTHVS